VGVNEEELQSGFGESLLDSNAIEGRRSGTTISVEDGVAPWTGGPIATLGRPDAAGCFADVADVSVDGGADLGSDAFVCAEQRHVTVSGAAGNDVDEASVVEVAKGGDEIAVEVVEIFECFREETRAVSAR